VEVPPVTFGTVHEVREVGHRPGEPVQAYRHEDLDLTRVQVSEDLGQEGSCGEALSRAGLSDHFDRPTARSSERSEGRLLVVQ